MNAEKHLRQGQFQSRLYTKTISNNKIVTDIHVKGLLMRFSNI